MHFTDAVHIKNSFKKHRCSWCNEVIGVFSPYWRYRFYDGGDAGTVKMHDECYEAMIDSDIGHDVEFLPGDNPRGCNCGFTAGCDRCMERKAICV